jgi:hypothetical protein
MLLPAAAEKIIHVQMQPLAYTRREMVRLLRVIGHGTLPEILPQVLFQILAVEKDAPALGNLMHQRQEPCIQLHLCRFVPMLYFYNNILQCFHNNYPPVSKQVKNKKRLKKSFSSREALIKSLFAFILEILCNARNEATRIASYLRSLMTKQCMKILIKANSMN